MDADSSTRLEVLDGSGETVSRLRNAAQQSGKCCWSLSKSACEEEVEGEEEEERIKGK